MHGRDFELSPESPESKYIYAPRQERGGRVHSRPRSRYRLRSPEISDIGRACIDKWPDELDSDRES